MVFDFADRNFPITLLTTVIFAVLLAFAGNYSQALPEVGHYSYLYQLFPDLFTSLSNKYLIGLGIVLIGIWLYQFNQIHQLITERQHLPMLLFTFLAMSFQTAINQFEIVLATFFLLNAFHQICSLYRQDYGLTNCFYCGFFLALSIMSYSLIALLIPVVILSLLTIKPTKGRSFIVFFAGLLCPYLFASAHAVLTAIWQAPLMQVYQDISFSYPIPTFSLWQHMLIVYTFLLFLTHRLFISNAISVPQKNINIKVVLNYFVIGSLAILVFFCSQVQGYIMVWAAVMTYPLSNLFSQIRSNFWTNLLFAFLLVLVVLSIVLP